MQGCEKRNEWFMIHKTVIVCLSIYVLLEWKCMCIVRVYHILSNQIYFYRTQVRSLSTHVTHWLTKYFVETWIIWPLLIRIHNKTLMHKLENMQNLQSMQNLENMQNVQNMQNMQNVPDMQNMQN